MIQVKVTYIEEAFALGGGPPVSKRRSKLGGGPLK
jgi:hypothetical protein